MSNPRRRSSFWLWGHIRSQLFPEERYLRSRVLPPLRIIFLSRHGPALCSRQLLLEPPLDQNDCAKPDHACGEYQPVPPSPWLRRIVVVWSGVFVPSRHHGTSSFSSERSISQWDTRLMSYWVVLNSLRHPALLNNHPPSFINIFPFTLIEFR